MKIHDEKNIYIHHILKLNNNPEQILNNMKSYCRRNIRKASRLGIRTEQSSSMNSVKIYYNLHCITRKRLGTPPQPLSFFKNIKKYIFDNNHGFIILGYFNDIPIAGAVFFHFGKKALFKFGASDQRFQQMRANNLILWEAIYYFAINKFKELSLGRTSQENIGLLNYKEGWGADRTKINYYTYPAIIQKSILIDHLIRISRKIITVVPVTILKTIVSRLYRFFP
ncbi:MAG: peptidoglycan bridge formation glycyltransferase FemA/FemB family protein [Spirochaetaceae bacterium]|nr:peptidoglycan bridge formation glycyltransferase FemA/FemB family protein [Spirochaetaceae bacterium]